MSSSADDIEAALRVALQDLFRGHPDLVEAVVERAAAIAKRAVQLERERCVDVCLERAELWRITDSARPGSPEPARSEARARQNEARYVAHALRQGPAAAEGAEPTH